MHSLIDCFLTFVLFSTVEQFLLFVSEIRGSASHSLLMATLKDTSTCFCAWRAQVTANYIRFCPRESQFLHLTCLRSVTGVRIARGAGVARRFTIRARTTARRQSTGSTPILVRFWKHNRHRFTHMHQRQWSNYSALIITLQKTDCWMLICWMSIERL